MLVTVLEEVRLRQCLPILTVLAACSASPNKLDCDDPPKAPKDLPPFELTTFKPTKSFMAGKHVLLNQNSGPLSWATTIDACGNHVWWEPPENPDNRIYRAKLTEDGESVLVGEKDREGLVDTAWIRRISTKNKIQTRTRTLDAHHDFEELGDGTLAFISHQYATNTWFPNMDEDLVSDVVRTVHEDTEEETDERLFSIFDDSGVEPWWICDHMLPSDRVPGFGEWSHSNSLMWESKGEALYLLVRYWDALLKLERDGSVAWHLGGPENEFAVIGDTVLPKHAHMSEYWPGGMLVFDNRNHSGLPSRVVEYAIDEETRTIQEVWSFEEPDGKLISFLGDAARLPGGNVLVAWSTEGRLSEISRDGDIVWEVQTEDKLGRIEWLADWPGEP